MAGLSPRGVAFAFRAASNKKSKGVDSLLLGESPVGIPELGAGGLASLLDCSRDELFGSDLE